MALDASGLEYEHREILLRNKPAQLLRDSPKGTVPILVLSDGQVLDESIDIMRWALSQEDPDTWLPTTRATLEGTESWLESLNAFKPFLDKYKYASRHPERSREEHRGACRGFVRELEQTLAGSLFLAGNRPTLADIALFPFVRQFHFVDPALLEHWEADQIKRWLEHFLADGRFRRIMEKRPLWDSG